MPSQPSYSEADLTRLWNESLDPSGVGLAQAIAMDIASYTGEPIEVVTARMASGATDFKAQWEQAQVDPKDAASVAAFYRTQVVEAYELAHWHAGLTTGEVPLNYARTATLAREVSATRVLDFGCGIGSGSIVLAGTGAEVHSADIARNLLDLTGHRLARHGYTPHLIDLTASEKPRTNYYDLISCFDVLEHIPDQLATVKELETYLRAGGRLVCNFFNDSSDPDRPMHISSAGNWTRLIRTTGLSPDWDATSRASVPVLKRHPLARLKNLAALVLHGE
jgi:2-polyprenyl-3-methyl-5-hydroxy-6-metoxy-1,4-benzoquinol methylase